MKGTALRRRKKKAKKLSTAIMPGVASVVHLTDSADEVVTPMARHHRLRSRLFIIRRRSRLLALVQRHEAALALGPVQDGLRAAVALFAAKLLLDTHIPHAAAKGAKP